MMPRGIHTYAIDFEFPLETKLISLFPFDSQTSAEMTTSLQDLVLRCFFEGV